ncbi:MAG: DoxX family protein [Candidatus Acidiferrales bacterium]
MIGTEFFGGLGLVVGLSSRLAAAAVALTMLGAIATVHDRYGLFMNWFGDKKGHGFEYHLLVVALALVIVVNGAGAFWLDHAWSQHLIASTIAFSCDIWRTS